MAIDTRSKRASVLGVGHVAALALPLPDGLISLRDRRHAAYTYAGPDDLGGRYAIRLRSEDRGIAV